MTMNTDDIEAVVFYRKQKAYATFKEAEEMIATAYKHVSLIEENPCEAVHKHVYSTRNVADMAVRYNVDKFIMISTDKAVNLTNASAARTFLFFAYRQKKWYRN